MFLPTQAMLVWKCLELILHGTCRYYFFASNYFQGHPGPFTRARCSVSAATSIAPPFLSPKTDSPRTLRGGWLKHLQTVLRAAPSALVFGGPPCSSFVWANRATSGRSKEKPEGFTRKEYIKLANLILGLYQLVIIDFAFHLEKIMEIPAL